uniref:MADF domain-containing protein n=1 Tax=Cacopsylla melanoneura TaxID=428564 RepID=A0A8D9AT20_9HEMI
MHVRVWQDPRDFVKFDVFLSFCFFNLSQYFVDMDDNNTERLISLVRESASLWNINDENWKNTGKKAKQWADIGKELNQSSQEVSKKWEILQDSYLKYIQAVKGSAGMEKSYINWPWAGQLEFLRDSLTQRKTASNIEADTQLMSTVMEEGSIFAFEDTQILPPGIESEESQMLPPVTIPDGTIVLNQKKSKSSHDLIDNLFLSYAETFKSCSPRTQADLKMQMAQMFGRAELKELNAKTSTANPTSGQSSFRKSPIHVVYSSDSDDPHHVVYSSDSDDPHQLHL